MIHLIRPLLFLALFSGLFVSKITAATCKSTGSSSWATGSSWSCGSVPTCGDSVVIQSGHTMTISVQQDLRGCGSNLVLVVYGTLKFTTGNKLRLACNSRVYVFGGGSLVPGGGGGNSNELEICGNTMWQAGDGIYTGPGCFPSTLTTCAKVLPVELVLFQQVECEEGGVCLKWETVSEHNNSFFELERSADGVNYQSLERISSRARGGNSLVRLSYGFRDAGAPLNINYYRLKQVDTDRSYTYSDVIYVNHASIGSESFQLFPNPNPGRFSYKILGLKSMKPVSIELREASGRQVYEKTINPVLAGQSGDIDLGPGIRPGFYICYLHTGNNVFKTKVLIQGQQ